VNTFEGWSPPWTPHSISSSATYLRIHSAQDEMGQTRALANKQDACQAHYYQLHSNSAAAPNSNSPMYHAKAIAVRSALDFHRHKGS
jgi:hypothetical protein